MPSSMMPYRYNNGIHIMQAPGYVILDLEMMHETRIVPVDGRPALSPRIKQWMGESRGRWEGNTLVIETTNFKAGAVGNQHRRDGIAAGESIPDERADEDDGAHHAAQRQTSCSTRSRPRIR